MSTRWNLRSLSSVTRLLALSLAGVAMLAGCNKKDPNKIELLNVSYDPTRELWTQMNAAFIPHYEKTSGKKIAITQSHAGSSKQAGLVVNGLEADVVTLAIWPDVEQIRKAGLSNDGWEQRLPNGSLPYTSTIVFVVRKGNPKGVRDWNDLIRDDIEVITPDPKTSGNGKLSLLAAWGSVTERGGTQQAAEEFITKLYKNAPILPSGARDATIAFAKNKLGDVHLTWENEAFLEVAESNGELEIVNPPISVLAEPTVAWVDANVKRKGTAEVAEAYLKFLYTPEGQEIIAKNYYRPIDANVQIKYSKQFPKIELFSVGKVAGNWNEAQKKFFDTGAIFSKIYAPKTAAK
jgi:sulfate/thiosulfate-binding protein